MNASGMGWDDTKGCCVCDKDVFAEWVKGHKYSAGMTGVVFHTGMIYARYSRLRGLLELKV
ncbi:hypothetical protein LINPERHAP2_LOCUS4262 [Linum perenne]